MWFPRSITSAKGTNSAEAFGLAVAGSAQPIPITVPDYSFEAPTTSTYQNNSGLGAGNPIPGTANAWYFLGGYSYPWSAVGVQNVASITGGFSTGAPDGSQDAYINNGTFIGSGALTTIAANTTYTLTVAEGNRTGGFPQTAGFTFALACGPSVGTSLINSANWAASRDVPLANSPAPGTFADYSVSFTTGSSDASIGQSLFVVLGSDVYGSGENPIDYDNVRLTAASTVVPNLQATLEGGQMVIRWPVAAGYSLYTSPVPGTGANWTRVIAPLPVVDPNDSTKMKWTGSVTGTKAFCRLQQN